MVTANVVDTRQLSQVPDRAIRKGNFGKGLIHFGEPTSIPILGEDVDWCITPHYNKIISKITYSFPD